MTWIGMALAAPVCMALGAVARYARDVAVLRRLERLLEGCNQRQRGEVCRILASSLHPAGEPSQRDEQPPAEAAEG